MARDLSRLRAEVEALAPAHCKNVRRYPRELKGRLARFAAEWVARGESMAALSEALDMPAQTLAAMVARYATSTDDTPEAALVPVDLITARVAERITVRGPYGVVVEGLDVDDIARLLRALS